MSAPDASAWTGTDLDRALNRFQGEASAVVNGVEVDFSREIAWIDEQYSDNPVILWRYDATADPDAPAYWAVSADDADTLLVMVREELRDWQSPAERDALALREAIASGLQPCLL